MSRFILPFQSVYDLNGHPLDGAKLYFYETGTSTPKDTFTDAAFTIPNTNPVVADSQGEFGEIFLDGVYRVELQDKDGVTQPNYPADNVPAAPADNVPAAPADVYETVAAMKLVSIDAGSWVQTKGYYAAGDGGHGSYLVKTLADAGTPDGYGDHSLANGNVAVLQTGEELDVLQFGAKGTGVAGKVQDTAAFAAAAALAKPIVVRNVHADGYFVTGVTRLYNSVRGVGLPKITISKIITYDNTAANDGAAQIFRFLNHLTPCAVSNIHFVGDFDGTTGTDTEHAHAIAISSSSDKEVVDCKFEYQYGDAVYIGKYNWGEADASTITCKRVYVDRCVMNYQRRCAVAVVDCNVGEVTNCNVYKANTFVSPIVVEPNLGDGTIAKNIRITGNVVDSATTSVGIYCPASYQVKGVIIEDNILGGTTAIYISSGSSNAAVVGGVTITNNKTSQEAVLAMVYFVAIHCDVRPLIIQDNWDLDAGRWVIKNNTEALISGNTLDVTNTVGTGHGLEMRDCSKYSILNNTFIDLNTTLVDYGAITISKSTVSGDRASNLQISGNRIRGCNAGIVFRHTTETAGGSFIVQDSLISDNYIEAADEAYRHGAEVTLTRIRILNNHIYGGTSNMVKYDLDGYILSVAGVPEFVGQEALVGGIFYKAIATSAAGDWKALN